jgi:hypothetical protein
MNVAAAQTPLPGAEAKGRLLTLTANTVAVAGASMVILVYLASAGRLVVYPWDWSPDEGLYLDYARRLLEQPAGLHGKSFVPFPSAYGPALSVLLAPAVASGTPLLVARLIAVAWTLAIVVAVFLLVRRKAPWTLALAAAAWPLVPFDVAFWHVLVRPDGLMLALLAGAALALLPERLAHGGEQLSAARAAAGTALLLGAVLTKATAALHGAPLVLGWLLVDRRGGMRLVAVLGTAGLTALALLQWLTDGGYLWVNRVWSYHPSSTAYLLRVVTDFLRPGWPVVAVWVVTLLLSSDRRKALRDGSTLLVAAGAMALPISGKFGASWNYLVPALPFLAVAVGRTWASPGKLLGVSRATAGAGLLGAGAVVLAMSRPFPLPTAEDERTARAFYSYVADVAAAGGPILAMRPEYAYFHVRQQVEMEGSGYVLLARGGAPGSELLERRLAEARYSIVIRMWPLPKTGSYQSSLERSYAPAGRCTLAYYFGRLPTTLWPRRDLLRPLAPPPGTRCTPEPVRQVKSASETL